MTTQYFMNKNGSYVGAYSDGAIPSDGLIECSEPPYGLACWRNGAWVMPSATLEQQQAARATAYALEADPLFFMAQRGKATQQQWLDKIAEIEARYPYPEV